MEIQLSYLYTNLKKYKVQDSKVAKLYIYESIRHLKECVLKV